AQGPEGMKPDVMEKYAIEMEDTMRGIPEIESMWTTAQKGQVFGAAILTYWSARSKNQSQIMGELMPSFTSMPGLCIFSFPSTTVLSGGQGGVSIAIKTPHSYEELEKVADIIASKLRESGLYKSIYHDLQLGVPQLDIDIDRDKAALS